MRCLLPATTMLVLVAAAAPAQSTDPAQFTLVRELGRNEEIPVGGGEVDKDSTIQVSFNTGRMAPPKGGAIQVQIDVELYVIQDGQRRRIYDVPLYSSTRSVNRTSDRAASGSTDTTTVSYVLHTKPFDPGIPGRETVPSTSFSLPLLNASEADYVELWVINAATQQRAFWQLRPRAFGFRAKAVDSLLFLKRFGVGDADRKNGIEEVNFGPSPGVTYGGVYFARRNPLARFFQPGFGVNVSFMNWKDPAYDVTTGKFAPNTGATDVNVGMGAYASLFNNVLQFTYGVNLHANQDRLYFGVGVSFIQLGGKIASLLQRQPAGGAPPSPGGQ